jgi:hypothetical protein
MRLRPGALLVRLGLGLALVGCTAGPPAPPDGPTPDPPAVSAASTPPSSPAPRTPPAARPTADATPWAGQSPPTPPARFDAGRAFGDVERLAEDIGPREATSRGFARAADLVADRFTDLGYQVRRTSVRVPAGSSWGVPVRRGTSQNVIAEPPGFDVDEKHVVIGAHLDTVAVAPGAEDNASGVAVLLELARLLRRETPDLPVQLVAFGAEEPRGPGDALHHFGSQQLVADLSRAERRSIVAMVSLDRVGVRAAHVPVCRAGANGTGLRADLRRAGRRAEVPTRPCSNTSSDHWSYEKAGIPAVRIGSVPYAGYHSRGDVVAVIDRRQLDRVGRLMWSWLRSLE